MTFKLDDELSALSRSDTHDLRLGRVEQLVWDRIAMKEERIQQRRVRSSVLIFTIAAAFVGGIIIGGHETDTRSRALLVDDADLLLPAAIN